MYYYIPSVRGDLARGRTIFRGRATKNFALLIRTSWPSRVGDIRRRQNLPTTACSPTRCLKESQRGCPKSPALSDAMERRSSNRYTTGLGASPGGRRGAKVVQRGPVASCKPDAVA
jgi:hypothetical protein